MTCGDFVDWLRAYGSAWTQQHAAAVTRLFTEDATYFETPFDEPMVGHEAIHAYWVEGAEQGQRDITFRFDVLSFIENVGVAHWEAAFTRVPSGQLVLLDGVLRAAFEDDGRCGEFREWWHRKEESRG